MILQNEKLNAIINDVPKENVENKMNCLFLFGLLEKVLSEKDPSFIQEFSELLKR